MYRIKWWSFMDSMRLISKSIWVYLKQVENNGRILNNIMANNIFCQFYFQFSQYLTTIVFERCVSFPTSFVQELILYTEFEYLKKISLCY